MLDKVKDIRIDLDSKVWGPNAWFFIDSIVLSYPLNPSSLEKDQYRNFFYSFPIVLPCTKCRVHFNEYITDNPLNDVILSSKDQIIKWILSAHNNISIDRQITIDDYYKYYNDKYNIDVKNDNCISTCGLKQSNKHYNQNSNMYKILSIFLFAIIIALSLYLLRSIQIANC
jgi:hypothetical protein